MATINSAALALITVDDTVTVSVTFNAVFTPFERQLAGLGLRFHRHLDVIGIDPAGSFDGSVLATFPLVDFPVTVGAGTQSIPVSTQLNLARATLQEDSGLGDTDEIRVKIRIHAVGMPAEFTPDVFTDQETLLG
jgi:hypothetical protein